ncbi:sporulation histidine kinase inhibitor Sda [Mesobacillus subterraneus]|uniref:sporulation histidine kinase inhibitor Sda n=1 Tax=Mesobacillus subterraneus TaxID=285983 RepID=UPI001CFF0E76|nr:sporulation histidine kinase inhibitor Sda [Mesobacillus subterraneus]WLR57801.1 sporulation histidine kinase inhibitor Sda [Mesobacillus subterraneus]
MVTITLLWELSDEKLIEAYQQATLLNLDEPFIEMLIEELDTRGLEIKINAYVS